MKSYTADLVIIGGGCAGLGLGHALHRSNSTIDCIILESRKHYDQDKTWCFWEKTSNIWTQLATKNWSQWSFQIEQQSPITHQSNLWRYYHLPASHYYAMIEKDIAENQHVQLQLSQTVFSIKRQNIPPYHWHIQTQTGDTISAKKIIDTRPPKQSPSMLYQCFFGIETTVSKISETTAQLMHQMRTDKNGFRFNYILPLSDKRILFEHTRFCPDPISREQLKNECLDALGHFRRNILSSADNATTKNPQSHPNKNHQSHIIREEWGCLPMGIIAKQPAREVTAGGIRDGALREASGYGFLRIQDWANQLASQLTCGHRHGMPIEKMKLNHTYETQWQRFVDRLFLQTIKENPHRTPDFFAAIAAKVPPDVFARFMSDQANKQDMYRVIKALPSWPFIKQSIRSVLVG